MNKARATQVLSPRAGQEEVCAFFGLDEAACARLALYVEELARWNARVNLVAASTLPQAWVRHVADGLQLLNHLPEEAEQVIDLGSGGGIPGLVMALAAPRRARYTLVEANHKKCAFLRHVAQRAGVDITLHQKRIEQLAPDDIGAGPRSVIVARALAPLDRLLDMAAPLFESSAVALLLKGQGAGREIEQARQAWHFDSQALPSVTDENGVIVKLWRVHRV